MLNKQKWVKYSLILLLLVGVMAIYAVPFFNPIQENDNAVQVNNSNMDGLNVPKSAGQVNYFYDDFESGLINWDVITGLWHLTYANSSCEYPYYSYQSAIWFGNETTADFTNGSQDHMVLSKVKPSI